MKLLAILLFISSGAFATKRYVKASGGTGTGLDSNSNAWSYAKFNSTNHAGDTILFKRGDVFAGAFTPRSGTSSSAPTVYDYYSTGSNPTFSGFTQLSSWTQSPSNTHIYYASISRSFIPILTVDGVVKGMARYPNTGFITYTSHTTTTITGSGISSIPAAFTAGEIVVKKQRYLLDRHKVTGRSGTTLTYMSDNFYGTNTSDPSNNNGLFAQNDTSLMDVDGEWCYYPSTSRVYIYVASGTPSTRVIKVSSVSEVITFNSSANIKFNNLDINGGDGGVVNNSGSNIIFTNCNFSQQAFGIYAISCTGMTFNGGSIMDCASAGILGDAACNNVTLDGVTVRNCGTIAGLGKSGDGMYNSVIVVGDGFTMRNCIVRNAGFNGVYFDGNNALVEKNLFDTACTVKDDGAAIYTWCPDGLTRYNRIVQYNIVRHIIGNAEGVGSDLLVPRGAGIYLDGYSNHVVVTNNVAESGPWAGIFINANSNNKIASNTIYDFKHALLIYNTDTTAGNPGTVKNDTVTGNKFIARTATQETMSINLYVKPYNPALMGPFTNNYYARPIKNDSTIDVHYWYSGQDLAHLQTLAQWQSTYSQDAGSLPSQVTTTNINDLRFDYNYSASSLPVTLPAIYKDVTFATYPGTITLGAYGASVLVYNAALPTGTGYLIFKGRQVKTDQ